MGDYSTLLGGVPQNIPNKNILQYSHLARSKGPHSGGGRVQPLIQIKEPQCPAEPFLGEQGKGEGG